MQQDLAKLIEFTMELSGRVFELYVEFNFVMISTDHK